MLRRVLVTFNAAPVPACPVVLDDMPPCPCSLSLHHLPHPLPTLRAPLSGTLLQTLPDLVTPLKGGTLYLRAAVQRRGQLPPKISGTDKTVEAT